MTGQFCGRGLRESKNLGRAGILMNAPQDGIAAGRGPSYGTKRGQAIGSLARYHQWLFWHCTRSEFNLHSSSCAVVSAGVVAPVDVVRHCRHRRFSNSYFGRNCEGVREFPGISHWSRCVDDFGAAFIGDTHLNLGIGAVSRVTVRPRCCNCHRISRLGACRSYRIGRGKTRRPTARR